MGKEKNKKVTMKTIGKFILTWIVCVGLVFIVCVLEDDLFNRQIEWIVNLYSSILGGFFGSMFITIMDSK